MRKIPKFPGSSIRVVPGGPPRDRLRPPDIVDPNQKGFVTRHGSLDPLARAALVVGAMQSDPTVTKWASDRSISDADWLALQRLAATSIAPSSTQ